jgi:hypothetical protein
MAVAADYLREGQPLPQALADYLANALDKAAQAKGTDRANVLACELMVKQSANSPIKGRSFDVALLVIKHDAKAQTKATAPMEKALVSEVMDALGVSERTARTRISAARAGINAAPSLSSD